LAVSLWRRCRPERPAIATGVMPLTALTVLLFGASASEVIHFSTGGSKVGVGAEEAEEHVVRGQFEPHDPGSAQVSFWLLYLLCSTAVCCISTVLTTIGTSSTSHATFSSMADSMGSA